MKHVVVLRTQKNDVAVYGILFVVQDSRILFQAKTIENRAKLCASGVYDLKLEHSPRFKTNLWELYGVPKRSEIKIHVANYWNQLDGCIGVGQRYSDINDDGIIDLAASQLALQELHAAMGDLKESRISIFDVS